MATLSQTRALLAAALTATGYRTFDHVPDKVEPPALIVTPSDTYVAESDTFDQTEFAVQVDLYLLVSPRANKKTAQDLDAMLGRTLGLLPVEWSVTGCDRPDYLTTHDWLAYGIRLQLASTFNLDESETPE